MSLKMTTQVEWIKYARYSKYHPDNISRAMVTPNHEPVKGPPPIVSFDNYDRTVKGAWGHSLCCERPYGKQETTTRIKDHVAPKVGSSWHATMHFEKDKSVSCSAMYGGSLIDLSFEEIVEIKNKKG
ncbi:hypothetical protein AB1Y20_008868 [Prymnesium parvum]|uniref:Uncharacterized protein n=1 Tax=Prymnesium parvum TaxID=97485 RepID=A0AB34IUK1_PRYPA|mmetsp:Transcript_21947/g.54694  ORF Transcript_21947/g.54694 Transcript_21947/m.54694 type:complete len:127 (+) Transcript_21947:245-625(+)|eukprot:CAMPEP_0182806136 /NCGR_PEP_ID=MMETSP0006_2-20121128/5435_1 /TAXON_ID=97485 /ORGANISM="Prymnesium parvum, Strain Texoma1" /LENGTH=126 /DNA_ID=CAMNT_0024931725 /DNA_START=279 /DNA_END=659 /DNA_ORIENTATION=-